MTHKSNRTLSNAQSEAHIEEAKEALGTPREAHEMLAESTSADRQAREVKTKATIGGYSEEALNGPEDAGGGAAQRETVEAHSQAQEQGGTHARAAAQPQASQAQAWRPTMLGVHLSGVGVACWGPDEQHFTFLPADPVEGRCQKYRLAGIGQQLEDGTFVFSPGGALPQRAQSVLICQLPHGRLSLTRDHAIQLTLKMRLAQHSVMDIARIIMQESGEAWEELTLWHQSRKQQAESTSIRPLGDDSPRTHEASPTQSREPRKSTAGDCEVEGWQAQPVIIVRREEGMKGDGPEATPQAGSTTLVGLASEGAWKRSSTTQGLPS